MKKIYFALAVLASAPVAAQSCIALDYQEMKDMPAEELITEACKAREAWSAAFDESTENLGSRGNPRLYADAQKIIDQCSGQITRIDRVLSGKGITKDSINETCRSQAIARKAAIDKVLGRTR